MDRIKFGVSRNSVTTSRGSLGSISLIVASAVLIAVNVAIFSAQHDPSSSGDVEVGLAFAAVEAIWIFPAILLSAYMIAAIVWTIVRRSRLVPSAVRVRVIVAGLALLTSAVVLLIS